MSKYSFREPKYKPRKAITKIDIESHALSGRDTIEVGEFTTITDEAREKAQQLGIKVIVKAGASFQKKNANIDNLTKEIKELRSSVSVKSKVDLKNHKKIIDSVVAVLKEKSLPVNEELINQIVLKIVKQI